MAVVVTIAGVDRTAMVESFSRERAINQSAVARLVVFDELGAYRPAERTTLVITVDGVTSFNGTIVRVGVAFWGPDKGCRCSVDALSGNFLLQRILFNGIVAGPTMLKAVLQALPLAAAGVTLDAAQVNGPALETFTSPWMRVDAVVNRLSSLTGYIWGVDFTNQLKMWLIGSVASGITFNAANLNADGETSWSHDAIGFVNFQVLVYGPTETLDVTDVLVTDGVAMSWPLVYHVHVSNYGTVAVSGLGDLPLTDAPDATLWSVVAETPPILLGESSHRLYAPTGAAAPAAGTATLRYVAQFPDYVYSEDAVDRAANGDWAVKDERTAIVTASEAQAEADGLRRRFSVVPKALTIPSFVAEVTPGETCTVTIADLGLSGTFLAITSRLTYANGELPKYSTSLISGDELPQSWVEWWQEQAGGGSGGAAGGSGGGVIPSTSPSPVDYGGTMTRTAVSGTTTAQNVPDARDIPGDDRTWVVDVLTRSQFAAHTATPRIVRCSAAHVVVAAVATGAATASISSDPSAGNWQALGPFVAEVGYFYRLQVTMNSTAGSGTAMGVAHVV